MQNFDYAFGKLNGIKLVFLFIFISAKYLQNYILND